MKRAAFVAVVFVFAFVLPATGAPLKVFIIDVGQGSSTLIVGPAGKTVLVDAGPGPSASGHILHLLSELHIRSLNAILATHYHSDHIGGFCDVLAATGAPKVAYDRGGDRLASENSSPTPTDFTSYLGCIGPARNTVSADDDIDLGGGAVIHVLAVGDPDFRNAGTSDATTVRGGTRLPCANTENEKSIALAVEYRGFDMLLMGDLTGVADPPGRCRADALNVEGPVGTLYAGPPFDRHADVYVSDHHGSDATSNGAAFLGTILPDVAVISTGDSTTCGPGFNVYGDPGQRTLDRLWNVGVQKIYQTQEGGARAVSRARPCTPVSGQVAPRDYHGVPHDFLYARDVRITTDGTTYTITNAAGGSDSYTVNDAGGR